MSADPKELALKLAERLLTAEQAMKMPAPAWLVDDYLTTDSLAMLYGAPGSFKSFLALDLACSISAGYPWAGKEVKQGPVLYLAAEGRSGMSKRLEAWTTTYGEPGPFHLYPDAIPLLDSERYVPALVELVRSLNPVLIIVDTLARSVAGGDENSSRDMSSFVANLDALRHASGACVLVVHHTGKGTSTYRGSSALEGAMDSMLSVEADDSGTITLSTYKQKETDKAAPLMLYREEVTVREGTATSCVLHVSGTVRHRQLKQAGMSQVVQAFLDGPRGMELSVSQIMEVAGVPRSSVYRVLGALVREGILLQSEEGYRAKYVLNPAKRKQMSQEISDHPTEAPKVSPPGGPRRPPGETLGRPEDEKGEGPPTLECPEE